MLKLVAFVFAVAVALSIALTFSEVEKKAKGSRAYESPKARTSEPSPEATAATLASPEKAVDKPTDTDVIAAARYAVRHYLKAPDSATFPLMDSDEYGLSRDGNEVYRVSGWVDATNSFNAKLRTKWLVTLSYDKPKDKWYVKRLVANGKTVVDVPTVP